MLSQVSFKTFRQSWGHLRRATTIISGVKTTNFSNRQYCTPVANDQNIIYSPVTELPPHPTGNFVPFALESVSQHGDKVAIECMLSGSKTTFSHVKDQVSRWAGYITSKGMKKGDVIAIIAPNIAEYSPVVLGNGSIGCITTTMNPTSTPDEVARQLQDSGAKMVVFFSPLEPLIKHVLNALKKDLPTVAVGPSSPTGVIQAKDIFADQNIKFAEPIDLNSEDPFVLMYSSGTTGRPKGTLITHGAAIAQRTMIMHPTFMPQFEKDSDRAMLMVLPMFHVAGLLGAHPICYSVGIRQVLYPKFDPNTFLQTIHKYNVTEIQVAPTLLNFMIGHPSFNKESLKSIQTINCGTAPLPPSIKHAFLKKIDRPITFQQIYGMTECLAATIDPLHLQKDGYAGQLMCGITAKILDLKDGKTTLPPNTEGELLIKSPCNMKGYLNNPEATAQTLDADGFIHTGDIGQYDEDGFIRVVDRTKDLIKVKGFQVSPGELEDVILQLPEVLEAGVVGVPNDQTGEAPVAFVVPRAAITKEKINEFISKKLAKHKQLTGGIMFVEALPKNTTGKVLKKTLQEMATQKS